MTAATSTSNGTAANGTVPTPASAAPAAAARQLVVCALGAEEYGVPIEQVREIVRYAEPRPVASELPWMRGVIGLRGRLVPVHDLAARLGVTSPAGDRFRSPEGETRVAGETHHPPASA